MGQRIWLRCGLGYTAIKPIRRSKRRTRLGPTSKPCCRNQTVIRGTP